MNNYVNVAVFRQKQALSQTEQVARSAEIKETR